MGWEGVGRGLDGVRGGGTGVGRGFDGVRGGGTGLDGVGRG